MPPRRGSTVSPPPASACSCRPAAMRWTRPRRCARAWPSCSATSRRASATRFPTTPRVSCDISIGKVVETLLEAVALVFLVMFLFLQNWRYTIIPTIVVPVALMGTFAVLLTLGYSINVLTMFGMVLVIGIVVDDAIVVVENVERIMSEEGLPPLAATRKAMGQISGAIVGVTVVLIVGVRAAGLLQRRSRQHLPPVLGGDGLVDRLLGLPGAVADAGAVRHAAQARRGRPPPCQVGLLRLVQPRLLRHRPRLRRPARRGCSNAAAACC